MNVEELKLELRKIFGEVEFNKDFDKYAVTIKNLDVNLIPWCIKVKNEEILAIPAKRPKDVIIFIKKIGSSNRCIIIKIVNDEFKEVHLGDHRYYDKLRDKLGIKMGSRSY